MKLPVRYLHFGELWPVTSFTRERERERERKREREREKLSTPNVKVSRAFGSCWRSSGRSSARQDWYSTVINSTDFEGKQLRASFRYHLGILRQASPDFYAISRRNPILSPAQTGIAFYPAFYGFPIIKSIAESLGESPEYPKALAARWLLAIELAADTEIFSGSVCVCVWNIGGNDDVLSFLFDVSRRNWIISVPKSQGAFRSEFKYLNSTKYYIYWKLFAITHSNTKLNKKYTIIRG